MTISARLRAFLVACTAVVLTIVYLPLALVVLNSFNTSKSFAWPPSGLRYGRSQPRVVSATQ